MREIFSLANLLSLSRLPLACLVYWALSEDETLITLLLILFAGITDLLDGAAARWSERRTGRKNQLGVALDPTADKIFAIAVLMGLIAFREFPLWLAALIIGRDLLILIAGMILLKKQSIVVPSNLPGKYYFASLAFLLFSYVAEFEFGIILFLPLVLLLWVWSLYGYTRIYTRLSTEHLETSTGRTGVIIRSTINVIVIGVYLVMFYLEAPYELW